MLAREILSNSRFLRSFSPPPAKAGHILHVGQGGQGQVVQGGGQRPEAPWHRAVRRRLVQVEMGGEEGAGGWERRMSMTSIEILTRGRRQVLQ